MVGAVLAVAVCDLTSLLLLPDVSLAVLFLLLLLLLLLLLTGAEAALASATCKASYQTAAQCTQANVSICNPTVMVWQHRSVGASIAYCAQFPLCV